MRQLPTATPPLAPALQAQLRGIISDYQGGDEALFAQAFESFDMLSRYC